MATSHEREGGNKTPVSPQKAQKGVEQKVKDYDQEAVRQFPNSEPLTELLNQSFTIEEITFYNTKYGEMALVRVGPKLYRTVSQVLIKQLKSMAKDVQEGWRIRVKLIKVKRYYTFAKPE
jgi:hypothetical protein